MKVAIAFLPAVGHFYTALRVYEALTGEGHEVALCGSRAIARLALPSRLPVVPIGYQYYVSPESVPTGFAESASTTHENDGTVYMAVKSYQDSRKFLSDWRPNLLVREDSERGSAQAAEALGIPHVSVITTANAAVKEVRRRDLEYSLRIRRATQFNQRYDFSLDRGIVAFGPGRFFGEEQDKVAVNYYRYKPASARCPPPDHEEEIVSRPRAVISLGSFMKEPQAEFFTDIVSGLREAGLSSILAVIRDDDTRSSLSAQCILRLAKKVNLLSELRQSDILVGHGGANSTMESLYYGVVPLIIPFGCDTPFVASRCVAGGYGVSLQQESVSAANVSQAVYSISEMGIPQGVQEFRKANSSLPGDHAFVAQLMTVADD